VTSGIQFRYELRRHVRLDPDRERRVLAAAEITRLDVDAERLATLDADYLSAAQITALRRLEGRSFRHRWQLADALAELTDAWRPREGGGPAAAADEEALARELDYVVRTFSRPAAPSRFRPSGG
jgi:PiT family inorganic phosphate transporter